MSSRMYICLLALLAFASACFAQASTTVNASATLEVPLSLEKTSDLQFGRVGYVPNQQCWLEMDANGQTSGSQNAMFLDDLHTPATFNVTGTIGRTIGVNTGGVINLVDAAGNPSPVSVGMSPPMIEQGTDGNSATVKLGAHLMIQAPAQPGNYSGTFQVSVYYQ